MDSSKHRFPWDWLIVLAALVAVNFVVESQVDPHFRAHSFARKAVDLSKLYLGQPTELDFLILGDSRAQKIDARGLQEALLENENIHLPLKIQNASTNSGSWVSSFSLLRMVSNNLTNNGTVLLCISEYWLEQPEYQTHAGVLPIYRDYLLLGEPALTLTSLIPLSSKRGKVVNRLRTWAEYPFRDSDENNESPVDTHSGMDKSNVDLWFSPITKDQMADNLAFADHALGKIRSLTPNLILVYLPNAPLREAYVDEHFPERRERFLGNMEQLAAKHGIPFVNLRNQLGNDALYLDFHHWNSSGTKAGNALLAKHLAPFLRK